MDGNVTGVLRDFSGVCFGFVWVFLFWVFLLILLFEIFLWFSLRFFFCGEFLVPFAGLLGFFFCCFGFFCGVFWLFCGRFLFWFFVCF